MERPARMMALQPDSAAPPASIGHGRRFLVLRHAPTPWNAQRRIQGRADVPLSASGLAAARSWRVPAAFAAAPCLASPLARALQTARAMGMAPQATGGLVEMDWGRLEGQTLAAMRQAGGARFAEAEAAGLDFRPDGGETPREVGLRAIRALEQAPALAVIVTHKGVMRALLAHATGWDMRGKPPCALPRTGQAMVLDLGEKGLRIAVNAIDLDA